MKQGVYPAAVTPFDDKGNIDMTSVVRLLAWYQAAGCTGVVLAGTNGEGPSLSAFEKKEFLRSTVRLAEGLEVILGVATPSLDEAIWLCKQTHNGGGHAALVMPPGYYPNVTDEGIARWFEAVMDASPVGVIAYNFPKRSGITLSPETMARLARHENMLGVKDSSGNRENLSAYSQALAGTGKKLFVGDETLLIDALNAGWTGTISGAANVIPTWLAQIVREWSVDPESAAVKFAIIEPALRAIRTSPQPATNKQILRHLGVLPSDALRLPLEPADPSAVQSALDLVKSLIEGQA